MTERSPTATRLLAAAIPHFAQRGYDGSSLTEIANAVGIRKASIYAHFAGKDALYEAAFLEVIAQETQAVRTSFAQERAHAQPGSRYCAGLLRRHARSDSLRFLLRTSYMPPEPLHARVNAVHEEYLAELRAHVLARLRSAPGHGLDAVHATRCADGYMGIVDSLQVKLVYTDNTQARARLRAMQHLFDAALTVAHTAARTST